MTFQLQAYGSSIARGSNCLVPRNFYTFHAISIFGVVGGRLPALARQPAFAGRQRLPCRPDAPWLPAACDARCRGRCALLEPSRHADRRAPFPTPRGPTRLPAMFHVFSMLKADSQDMHKVSFAAESWRCGRGLRKQGHHTNGKRDTIHCRAGAPRSIGCRDARESPSAGQS